MYYLVIFILTVFSELSMKILIFFFSVEFLFKLDVPEFYSLIKFDFCQFFLKLP